VGQCSNARYYRRALQYARGVVSGRIVAGKYVRKACQRFLNDRKRSKAPKFACYFDAAAAGKACRFIERMPLTKGAKAKEKLRLILEGWQAFCICNIFGWRNKATGFRRFTEAYVKIARKNGKSELAAAIGLYMLAADGEYGAEIYCGATTEKQAMKVFKPAAEMVRRELNLKKYLGIEIAGRRTPEALLILDKNASFHPLVGKPGDGDNPSCYICDEYHEHDSNEQYDAMQFGMGARKQPLTFIITTAGRYIGGACHVYEDSAKKILDGVVSDAEHVFALIYEADAEDDWRSDTALYKANPNLNVTVDLATLRKDRADAIRLNKAGTFKAKRLCIWVGVEDGYFSMEDWLAPEVSAQHPDGPAKLADFAGRRTWLALDLAQKTDFCALLLWKPRENGRFDLWSRFWLPEATVDAQPEGHNYRRWAGVGHSPPPPSDPIDYDAGFPITLTDGAMVDFDQVEEEIFDIWRRVDGVELAFDPAHAAGIIPRLMKRGISCVEFPNTAKNMSDPLMLLHGYMRERRVRHSGNPVMNWMVSNTVRRKSRRVDLDYPDRSMPANKIDGVTAAIMALGRQIYAAEPPGDWSIERIN
jgi:phage terminase large subunit-like protein